jgi:superfamily II DNA/RNA helicase
VLVAADIAARGIDVDGGVACDQFRAAECARRLCAPDRPNRACRCAGSAVALCSDEERPYLRDIEKRTRCSILPPRSRRRCQSRTTARSTGPYRQPRTETSATRRDGLSRALRPRRRNTQGGLRC